VTWLNSSSVPHSVTHDAARVITVTDTALPSGAKPFDSPASSCGAWRLGKEAGG